jgi:hypothetical protein
MDDWMPRYSWNTAKVGVKHQSINGWSVSLPLTHLSNLPQHLSFYIKNTFYRR